MSLFTASRRLRLAVLAGCVLGLAGASSAQAATAINPLGCAPTKDLNTPLTSFGDHSLYALAPGGTFAGGTTGGWRLSNAALVAENEPYGVVGNDGSSLGLGANGVAISEPMCIDETFPNFRFFAKAAKAGKSPLTVTVLFMDAKGNIKSVKSGSYVAQVRGLEPRQPHGDRHRHPSRRRRTPPRPSRSSSRPPRTGTGRSTICSSIRTDGAEPLRRRVGCAHAAASSALTHRLAVRSVPHMADVVIAPAGRAARRPASRLSYDRDFEIVPRKGLILVAVAFVALVVGIAMDKLWPLVFLHVSFGAAWTIIDLFLGLVLGPIMGSMPPAARVAVHDAAHAEDAAHHADGRDDHARGRLAARARSCGTVTTDYPLHNWLVASYIVVGIMAIIALGLLEPANVAVLIELKKPQPDFAVIERLMKRFIYAPASSGSCSRDARDHDQDRVRMTERKLPPVTEIGMLSLALIVAGGIYLSAHIPGDVPLAPAVVLLVLSFLLLVGNLVALSRVQGFPWRRFWQVARWSLLAYGITAGLIQWVFLRTTCGRPARRPHPLARGLRGARPDAHRVHRRALLRARRLADRPGLSPRAPPTGRAARSSTGVRSRISRLDRVGDVPDVHVHRGDETAAVDPERDELPRRGVAAHDDRDPARRLPRVLHPDVVLVGEEVGARGRRPGRGRACCAPPRGPDAARWTSARRGSARASDGRAARRRRRRRSPARSSAGCGRTTTPSSTAQARPPSASSVRGCDADPDDDEVAVEHAAVRSADALDGAVALERLDAGAEHHLARRGRRGRRGRRRRAPCPGRARAAPRPARCTRDVQPALARATRPPREPIQPAPTTTTRAAAVQARAQRVGALDGAQVVHAVEVGARDVAAGAARRRWPAAAGRSASRSPPSSVDLAARRRRGRPRCAEPQLDVVLVVEAASSCTQIFSRSASPRRYSLDSGGRSYGRSASAPISTMRPSKPSSRRVSAALAPARPAPTITNVRWSGGHGHSPSSRARNSCRVRGSSRTSPWSADVTVRAPELLHAAQRHAQVLGLQDDADALGRELLLRASRRSARSAAPGPAGRGRRARRRARASTGR